MVALGFLNAWALWLLPLAAIPIIIHLLNRRRFQKTRWAAMTFLLAAMKRNRRRLRMEQWLILALRTLAVILLVLLVSRPQLEDSVFGTVRKHHVVCLDDSASMAHRGAASSAFDDARDAVQRLVTRLADTRAGDLLTVLLASRADQPIVPIARIGADTAGRVREELAKHEVGERGLAPDALLASAARQFEANDDAEQVVYHLVTDMRRRDWLDGNGEANPAVRKWLLAREAAREQVTFLTVGSDNPENLSITDLRCRERVCTVGLPLVFAIEITNRGRQNSAAGEFSVDIDGRSRNGYPLPPLGAGESTTIELSHTFHTPGPHGITATLAGDRFATDDVRAIAIDVRDHSRVLLVDGDPGDTIEESETFYLHAALEIRGSIDSGIEVRLIGEHELSDLHDEALANFDMVWLCNVARPNEQAVERLNRFVQGGGGLVMFLGNQIDIAYYNSKLLDGDRGLLPARLLEVAGDIDAPEPVHLAEKADVLFASNTEETEFMFEQLVAVGRYIQVEETNPMAAVRTPLRVRDAAGAPLLISRDLGAGRVYLITTSADAQWSSMPLWPVFVMTTVSMHRTAARPQDFSVANFGPDGTASYPFEAGRFQRDVAVTWLADATGERRTFSAPPDRDAEGDVQIPMRELRGFGLFEVELRRHDGSTRRHVLARNSDTAEGELERISSEGFRRAYPEELVDRVSLVSEEGDSAAQATMAAGSNRLWRWTGFALLLGMLLETVLAWRFGRR